MADWNGRKIQKSTKMVGKWLLKKKLANLKQTKTK